MRKTKYILLSVLSLLNIMFIPVFDVWGGVFPGDIDYDFFYAINAFFMDKDSWYEWVVEFSLAIFIPSLLMLIASFFNSKTGFAITSLLGFISELKVLGSFASQNELYEIIPSDDCSISIGAWTALAIFIISFIVALTSNKNKSNYHSELQQSVEIDAGNSSNHIVIEKGTFCPNCGNKRDGQSLFCGKCGHKF